MTDKTQPLENTVVRVVSRRAVIDSVKLAPLFSKPGFLYTSPRRVRTRAESANRSHTCHARNRRRHSLDCRNGERLD